MIPVQRTYAAQLADTEQYRHRMTAEDYTTRSVTIKHTNYKEGCVIILDVLHYDFLHVGLLKKVVVLKGVPYFWVRPGEAQRNQYREFCVEGGAEEILVHYSSLKSYKPLSPSGNEDSYSFYLYGMVYNTGK